MRKTSDTARFADRSPRTISKEMKIYLVATMVGLIVIAHVFLWRSARDPGLKLTFTILNVIGWSIVLAPILLIDRWLDAVKRRNRSDDHVNLT